MVVEYLPGDYSSDIWTIDMTAIGRSALVDANGIEFPFECNLGSDYSTLT